MVYKTPKGFYIVQDVAVGDTVERIDNPSQYNYQGPKRGQFVEVIDIAAGTYRGYEPGPDGTLVGTHEAKIKLRDRYGNQAWYHAKNFRVTSKGNNRVSTIHTHSIEQDKPTFLREFVEVLVEGVVTRSYIGDWAEFNNLSAAKLHAQGQITESIRSKNDYRKFAIFQQTYVAQAKQPEIEFV